MLYDASIGNVKLVNEQFIFLTPKVGGENDGKYK